MGIYGVATVIFALTLLTLVCVYLPCQIVLSSMKERKQRYRFGRAFSVTKSLIGVIACIALGIGLCENKFCANVKELDLYLCHQR